MLFPDWSAFPTSPAWEIPSSSLLLSFLPFLPPFFPSFLVLFLCKQLLSPCLGLCPVPGTRISRVDKTEDPCCRGVYSLVKEGNKWNHKETNPKNQLQIIVIALKETYRVLVKRITKVGGGAKGDQWFQVKIPLLGKLTLYSQKSWSLPLWAQFVAHS